MIMISHDLSILKNMCKRIAIMYLGEIVEIGNKMRYLIILSMIIQKN